MIKWVQIDAVAKSSKDFKSIVTLLELLGLRKGATFQRRDDGFVEFLPTESRLIILRQAEGDAAIDLTLRVTDPDTALELVKKKGFSVVKEHSGPESSHIIAYFDIQLPNGTCVRIFGPRVVANTVDTDHLALEGHLLGRGKIFALVVSRFNSFITERLLAGAIDGLERCGVIRPGGYDIVRVPGTFEIPSAARTLADTKKYDAIICLGCLLRGDTAHYDVIVNEVARGIGQSAQETGVPHSFGVLTCETLEQAIDRAGLKMGNKGFEAALAAVEMANLKQAISSPPSALSQKQIPRAARNDKRKQPLRHSPRK